MSVVDWVCKKIALESASERLSAITISRQQVFQASLTHAQTLPLAVPNGKREFVPRDQVFSLNCRLLFITSAQK